MILALLFCQHVEYGLFQLLSPLHLALHIGFFHTAWDLKKLIDSESILPEFVARLHWVGYQNPEPFVQLVLI